MREKWSTEWRKRVSREKSKTGWKREKKNGMAHYLRSDLVHPSAFLCTVRCSLLLLHQRVATLTSLPQVPTVLHASWLPTTEKFITRHTRINSSLHTRIRYLTCDVYCIHITIEFIQDNCKINCFTIIHKVTRCTHSCLTHKTTLSIWKPGSTYRWHEVTKEIFIVQARGQNLNYNVQWGRINKHETCKTSSFSSSKQFGIYSITKNSHKFVPAG